MLKQIQTINCIAFQRNSILRTFMNFIVSAFKLFVSLNQMMRMTYPKVSLFALVDRNFRVKYKPSFLIPWYSLSLPLIWHLIFLFHVCIFYICTV